MAPPAGAARGADEYHVGRARIDQYGKTVYPTRGRVKYYPRTLKETPFPLGLIGHRNVGIEAELGQNGFRGESAPLIEAILV
jgi:hypothetical protein